MPFTIAEVAVPLPLEHFYDYRIPEELRNVITLGKRVFVPFGKKKLTGYVVGLKEKTTFLSELKDIEDVLDSEPIFDEDMVSLCRWMAQYYVCSLGEVLQSVLPNWGRWDEEKAVMLTMAGEMEGLGLPNRVLPLIDLLKKKKNLKVSQIKRQLGWKTPYAVLASLEKQGVISSSALLSKRKHALVPADLKQEDGAAAAIAAAEFIPELILSAEQQSAMDRLTRKIKEGKFGVALLHGVTGSGKTEIYLRCALEQAKRGKQSLVLVPEISLTPQTRQRFKAFFGERVAVLHSTLSPKEWREEWFKIKSGQVWVVVGARSAVFAPVQRLGLIVLDEEQESSYKQSETPRYQTKAAALMRAKQAQALVLLGSATPSLESYYYGQKGDYELITFSKRVEDRAMAKVILVDMKTERKEGNKSVLFSVLLKKKIGERLEAGEQTILFLNRRGFSLFLLCESCGYTFRCPHCSVTLTYHQTDKLLKCHYCLYQTPFTQTCPDCKEKKVKSFGMGVQQVEAEVKKLFPQAVVDRMDMDSTQKKGAHEAIFSRFQSGETQILVGTQMIAKGLDFPGVTLVGVVSADTSLNFPDFRSAERTFQLLTQVAGRAGRGNKPGEVVIQTFTPEHYSIVTAEQQDYPAFYQKEIQFRKELGYPPFSRLVQVVIRGALEQEVQKIALDFRKKLDMGISRENLQGLELLGPAPCVIEKLRGYHRWQVLIKGQKRKDFEAFCQGILKAAKKDLETYKILVAIDVDPLGMA